jgi:Ca2+-binding EF-hand superfamily protein
MGMRVGTCMFVCVYVCMDVCMYDVQGIQRMSDMFKEFDKDNSGTIDRDGMYGWMDGWMNGCVCV